MKKLTLIVGFGGFVIATKLMAAPPPELLSQNYPLWIEQLKSPSPDLRINALQKLSEIRQADTLTLMAALFSDPNPEVRFVAIRMVGKAQNDEALTHLKGYQDKETDPYLASEIKRNIKSIEDYQKAQEKQKEVEKEKKEKAEQKKLKKGSAPRK